MGLFGSIASGLIGSTGDIFGAASSSKSVKSAAQAQLQATNNALAQQQKQYDQARSDYLPYLNAGTSALTSELNLLGLGGNDYAGYVNANPDVLADYQKNYAGRSSPLSDINAYGQYHYDTYGKNEGRSITDNQTAAIDALKASPLFTSQYNTGLDAILQGAAATGGLRGGNTALAQSNFGSSLLSSVIQNQLANLGGIANNGIGAAQGVSSAGQANTNAQTGLLTQQGNIQAGSILGQQGIYNNLSNSLQSTLQSLIGGGGISGLTGQTGGTNYPSARY